MARDRIVWLKPEAALPPLAAAEFAASPARDLPRPVAPGATPPAL